MTSAEKSAQKKTKARQSANALLWLAGMVMLAGLVVNPMATWLFFALAAFLALVALIYHPRSIAALIILVLSTVVALDSFPQYIDSVYFQRLRVAGGRRAVEPALQAVAAYYARTGQWPADNAAVGLPPPVQLANQHVSEIRVQQGVVRIRYKRVKTKGPGSRPGAVLALRPVVRDGKPAGWVCGHAAPPPGATVQGKDDTDVMPAYLPSACKQ